MTVLESAQRFGAATRKRRVRRWIVLGVVVALVALAVWVVWFSSLLTVREVRVLGTTTVSADQVLTAADVPSSVQLARVDVDGIASRIEEIPRVKSVEVRRGWPDVLVLVVTERTPLAVTKNGTALTYLDDSAARFGSITVAPRGLPLVVAPDDLSTASALAVVGALPKALRDTTTTVTAKTRDDVVLTLADGVTVRWGSAEQSDRKAAVLAALLRVRAASYDVSAPDLPTSRGSAPSAG
ncbi:MAG TPA: FtsQ-type POTRA domain-containing protein [Candidatus Nanopelagicales bacterium]|nr:FtsQ-type POTRA domain-containing protein [Candidatus Nanopelagicales bacterium]